MTVQWSNYRSFPSSSGTDLYNFQIKLFSTTNKIQIVYGSFAKDATVRNAQVGIKGSSNVINTGVKNRAVLNNGAGRILRREH